MKNVNYIFIRHNECVVYIGSIARTNYTDLENRGAIRARGNHVPKKIKK